jgi:hypothetical protein
MRMNLLKSLHRRAGQCREDDGAVPAAPGPEHHHAPYSREQCGAGQAREADLRGGMRHAPGAPPVENSTVPESAADFNGRLPRITADISNPCSRPAARLLWLTPSGPP